MPRYHTFCSAMLVVALLLGSWAVVDAAAKKSGPPDQRAIRPVPEAEFKASGAERRVALVIGNAAYADSPLHNPVNDANDMAAALRRLRFEVIVVNNADLRKMRDATEEFSRQLRRSDVGLFYYAGHGLQVAGDNYLVPIGARINREQDVQFETYQVGRLLGIMEDAGNALNLIILDACRNNPFARSFRSAQRGLAAVQAAPGSLLAYATAPGSVAADGQGRNGVYTRNLLRYMQTPGLPVEEMFKQVRISVRQETRQEQTPWESSSLTQSFSFVPSSSAPYQPASLTSPQPGPPPREQVPVVAALPPQAPPRPLTQPPLASGSQGLDKTLVNNIHMEFVLIPPGEFTMGAEGSNGLPTHKVALSRPFYMGKYEVTQAQWAAVMGHNPSYFIGEQKASNIGQDIGTFFQKLGGGEEAKKELTLDPNRPVERVSWNDVQEFIKRLNDQEGRGKYRLPTEAEWEYAARAGASSQSGGNEPLEQYAWCAQNASSTTHAVGQRQPNAWGLYDMFGNVWEWVQDWWAPYHKEAATDPQGPASGKLKIFRGGAWNQPPAACQPAHRLYDAPTFKYLAVGFRLAREAQ